MEPILGPAGAAGYGGDNGGVANSTPLSGSPARGGLRSIAAFGAVGLSISGLLALTGIGIPCPWRELTHTLCPFCGATTMGAALLRGDVPAAWSANQFVLTLLVGVAVVAGLLLVELLGGPAVRLPSRLADQRFWYALLGLAALAFMVLRNAVPLG